jgi:hypothetical protein
MLLAWPPNWALAIAHDGYIASARDDCHTVDSVLEVRERYTVTIGGKSQVGQVNI